MIVFNSIECSNHYSHSTLYDKVACLYRFSMERLVAKGIGKVPEVKQLDMDKAKLMYVLLFWLKWGFLKFHQRQTLCYLAFVELSMNAWIMDILANDRRERVSVISVRTYNGDFTTECVIQETYNDNNSNNSTTGNLRYMIFSCGVPKTLITIIIIRAMWPSSCWKCSLICTWSF